MTSTVATLSLPLAGPRTRSVLLAVVAGLACALALDKALPVTMDAISGAVAPLCVTSARRARHWTRSNRSAPTRCRTCRASA